MSDQAQKLRQLLSLNAGYAENNRSAQPGLVAVVGAKGGVGATSVAIGLAATLAHGKRDCVLIDAAAPPGATFLCGSDEALGFQDVLQGRKALTSVLTRTRFGFQLLPGSRAEEDANYSAALSERILSPLETLGDRLAAAVIDAGHLPGRRVQRFAQAADVLLLATTPDPIAVWETYQTLKQLFPTGAAEKAMLVVNQAQNARLAAAIHKRLARMCRRFLGIELSMAGFVPPGWQTIYPDHAFYAFWAPSPYATILRKIKSRFYNHPFPNP